MQRYNSWRLSKNTSHFSVHYHRILTYKMNGITQQSFLQRLTVRFKASPACKIMLNDG